MYVTFQLGNRNRLRMEHPAPRQGGTGVSASSVGTPSPFSVLGQGYNSLVGLPASVGMSSLDPGFT